MTSKFFRKFKIAWKLRESGSSETLTCWKSFKMKKDSRWFSSNFLIFRKTTQKTMMMKESKRSQSKVQIWEAEPTLLEKITANLLT